jgi:hypothetical protein
MAGASELGTVARMREKAVDLIHPGAPSPAAAHLPAQLRLGAGCVLLIVAEEGVSEITALGAVALSAGATRVVQEGMPGEALPVPADAVRLGEVVLAQASIDGILRIGRERFQPTSCQESRISAAVRTDNGLWEDLRTETIMGLLELGVAALITEAVAEKLATNMPDTPAELS